MEIDPNKQKALDVAIKQIDKAFGKGALVRLGDKEIEPIEAISTGSLGLDMALGIGGVPRGRIIEIYGPESSGKTTLALQIISVGYFSPGRDPTALAAGEMAVVLALSVVVGLWSGFPVDPSGKVLGAAVFMGLFATTFAFVAQSYSQKFTPATHAALIFASEPVFAALYSYLAAGEVLSLRGWVGGMLIVLGMVVAEMFPTFSKG